MQNLIMARSEDTALGLQELNEKTTSTPAPPAYSPCLEALCDLTSEGKEILHLLLESPEEIMREVKTPRQLFSAVKNYLIHKGRNAADVARGAEEIRIRLHAAWA